MRIEIQLRIVGDDDSVISVDKVLYLDKSDDRLEAVGLSLSEGKAVMAGIQERVVTAQAASFLDRHRCCNGHLVRNPGMISDETICDVRSFHRIVFQRCVRCLPILSESFENLEQPRLSS